MSKLVAYLLITAIVVSLLSYLGFSLYTSFYSAPLNAPTGEVSIVIEKGETNKVLAQKLKDKNLINNPDAFLLLTRLNPINSLQDGTYTLKVNKDSPTSLIDKINQETNRLNEEKVKNKVPTQKLTIREGLRADDVFDLLEQNGIISGEKIRLYAQNPANLNTDELKTKYPFLPKILNCTYGNGKTCIKYYLEGYIYPDTYIFFKPSSEEQIITKFLDNFKIKVWNQIQNQLGDKDLDKVITMASILEKETGRPRTGITNSNRDEVNQERRNVASVFYNRLEAGMKWGSDTTVEYRSGRKLCQQTFRIENCIFLDDELGISKYNTYQNTGYPIGPITSPEIENILAVLNPNSTNYLYFVSDVSGKTYFGATEKEHNQNIAKVNQINRGLGS